MSRYADGHFPHHPRRRPVPSPTKTPKSLRKPAISADHRGYNESSMKASGD